MDLTPDQIQLMEIFHPYALERQKYMQNGDHRFVHYTSADAAMNILKTKTVWMRKTSCMGDFMEVQHGLECLSEAYKNQVGDKFKSALNDIFSNITEEIENLFNSWQQYLKEDTYITSLSEHLEEENNFGRLSMWRAFSGTTGVALVLKNETMFNPTDALKAYTSPVAYLDDKAFQSWFEKIADNIKDNAELVLSLGRQGVINCIFEVFKYAVLCTKHPGFQEEKEWRIIYTPLLSKSEYLIQEIQVVRGVPQSVYKIPLKNIPEEGLVSIEIPQMLERIIIGPTEYSYAMVEAFEILLSEAGVKNPGSRIFVSDIPLRASAR